MLEHCSFTLKSFSTPETHDENMTESMITRGLGDGWCVRLYESPSREKPVSAPRKKYSKP